MRTGLFRAAAWLCVLGIMVVSLVPVALRPHIMADKHHEHFAAYLLCACCIALGYPRLRQVMASALILTALAAGLEFVQAWIPGRTPSVGDWASSAAGVCCGLLTGLGYLAFHRIRTGRGAPSRMGAAASERRQ